MLESLSVAKDADGCRSAGLHTNHHRLVGQESVTGFAEVAESLLETLRDEVGHPEVHRRTDESGGVGRLGQVVASLAVHEMRHALRRSGLLAIALHPCRVFEMLLKFHHREGEVDS